MASDARLGRSSRRSSNSTTTRTIDCFATGRSSICELPGRGVGSPKPNYRQRSSPLCGTPAAGGDAAAGRVRRRSAEPRPDVRRIPVDGRDDPPLRIRRTRMQPTPLRLRATIRSRSSRAAIIGRARCNASAASEPRSHLHCGSRPRRIARPCRPATRCRFCARTTLEPAAAASPYNISGGVPLGSVPVVADALDFLEWFFEPYHHTRIDRIASLALSLLVSSCPLLDDQRQPEWCDATRFGAVASASPLREIVYRASRLGLLDLEERGGWRETVVGSGGMAEHGASFERQFPGLQIVRSMLNELAANSDFVQPRHIAATFRQLRIAADWRLFAPERPHATIQVLGYLETLGLEFTHLWVTGLSQHEWPRSPAPTPFIPMRHLRAASVTRSDVEAEVAFARRLMRHWRASSASVIFSYPIVGRPAESAQRADRRSAPTADLHLDAPGLALSHPHFAACRSPPRTLQTTSRSEAPIIPGCISRGTGILRDQSACPFRAFARYRLHARQVSPSAFISRRDRSRCCDPCRRLRRPVRSSVGHENSAQFDVPTFAIAASRIRSHCDRESGSIACVVPRF